jgi:hypothetical protein
LKELVLLLAIVASSSSVMEVSAFAVVVAGTAVARTGLAGGVSEGRKTSLFAGAIAK